MYNTDYNLATKYTLPLAFNSISDTFRDSQSECRLRVDKSVNIALKLVKKASTFSQSSMFY